MIVQTGRRFLPMALLILMLTHVGCSGIQKLGESECPIPETGWATPFIFIRRTPAFGAHPDKSGLVAAVWADGRILRAGNEAEVGQAYLSGYLTSAQVSEVRRVLRDSGILSTSTDAELVIDAADEELTVRWANEVRTWAHSPGFEHTGNASSTNPRIIRIRQALMAIPLTDAVPAPAKQWRNLPKTWPQ